MDAAEAERSGLVSRVVPPDELVEEAMKARREDRRHTRCPAALMAKEAVNRAFEIDAGRGPALRAPPVPRLFATEDQKEGMAAFVEKRAPNSREVTMRRRFSNT